MPIARAKPVDQLYEECRDAELVVVPDPALAGALNRRLDAPHFGPFATTPRRLAAGRQVSTDRRRAFLRVIEATDLAWKAAATTIETVLDCWEHAGRPDAVLDYPGYVTPATEPVIETLRDVETTAARLTEATIPADGAVAVVGRDLFTPLERTVLPAGCRAVDPFAGDAFDPPPFRVFDSAAAIVDTVVHSVSAEDAERVAIVLDGTSRYASLVEAALEAAGIPYHGGPGFTDDPDHRAFLGLLRASQSGSGLRVADVRPILHRLGVEIDIAHSEKRVAALDRPELDWLTDFFAAVGRYTFDEAVSEYEAAVGTTLGAFLDELGRLGLASRLVTREAVDDLAFYLQTYDVPVDRHDDGVVLADAAGSVAVDRPAVFYLGLDEGWTRTPPRRPWVDREAAFARHLQQFQLLLQNGVEQHYLVRDERGGRPVTPCLYFEELLDEPYERFSDLSSSRHVRPFRASGDGFDRGPASGRPDPMETISQSALKTFVNCPRDYLFGRLVDSPDRDYFAVGTLFHDFAEVVIAHPDVVDAGFIDATVAFMLAETRPFDRPLDRGLTRTRYRVGLETIAAYLEANPPEVADFVTPRSGWGRNVVADHFDLAVETPHTEHWFEDRALGLRGKVDLVHGPTRLLDYKSGRQYSPTQVVQRSALDPPHDEADFQALMYLTWLRLQQPDEPLEFTFFHFLEPLDDVVVGDASLEDCLTAVAYRPVAFDDHVASRDAYDALRHDAPNACTKTFAQVTYEAYRSAVAPHPFPPTRDADELASSALGQALTEALQGAVGPYAYVEKGAAQALRFLRDRRDSTYFADDLDAFEAFVADRLAELDRYRAGEARFPVQGVGREPNFDRVTHRDLLLEGDG